MICVMRWFWRDRRYYVVCAIETQWQRLLWPQQGVTPFAGTMGTGWVKCSFYVGVHPKGHCLVRTVITVNEQVPFHRDLTPVSPSLTLKDVASGYKYANTND